MKLQKFRKNKKQKRIVIGSLVGILLLIGCITLYRTFALYKVEQSFDVLNGTVPDFSSGDVTLAFTVNNEKENGVAFPNKNEGFKVEKVTCENGVAANWDETKWGLVDINNSQNQSKIKCTINFKRYEESILNGAYPVLKEGLVPVTIDENGIVKKADITTEWYNYGKKEWANAVILVAGATEPEVGEQIQEEQIESYFVWIPKYKYKIFDMGEYPTYQSSVTNKGLTTAIEIEFGLEDTKNDENKQECKTPEVSGDNGTCAIEKWMTHPAFTAFKDSKGMWVGKFATGYYQDGDSWTTVGAEKDETDAKKVIIKPNVYSWRKIAIGNAFKTSLEYERGLDSHMMKNTEWGAIAYLSYSKYGTCNEFSCTEVRNNNSNNYVTGVAAKNQPETGYPLYKDYGNVTPGNDANGSGEYKGSYNYKTKDSTVASTTGNYTGIYDMSSAEWQFVAGVMSSVYVVNEVKKDNIEYGGQSKLESNDIIDLKYLDIYINGTNAQYNRRILGDATGEIGPFILNGQTRKISVNHQDEATFISSNLSWFVRGGSKATGTGSGIFSFLSMAGTTDPNVGFRIVLTPQ